MHEWLYIYRHRVALVGELIRQVRGVQIFKSWSTEVFGGGCSMISINVVTRWLCYISLCSNSKTNQSMGYISIGT